MLATARLLLSCFVDQAWNHRQLLSALRPQPDDYLRVFRREFVADIYAAYERLWTEPPLPPVASGLSLLEISAATGADLRKKTGAWTRFPAGYPLIARLFRPEPTWVSWTFRSFDGGRDVCGDGLVGAGDHLVYFPSPWRVLATAPRACVALG